MNLNGSLHTYNGTLQLLFDIDERNINCITTFGFVPQINSVYPETVTTLGGVNVDIRGLISGSPIVFCTIDDSLSYVTYLSNTILRCMLPALTVGKKALRVISRSGFVSNPLMIHVAESVIPQSVWPISSSIQGNTNVMVTLMGDNAPSKGVKFCRFDSTIVSAKLIDFNVVMCCII